jgi:(E)-4-hydroxy-3-methylbut-2-enyl-diphosphate synthase
MINIRVHMLSNFAKDLQTFKNWNPKVVDVGGIPLGGNHPVRIQSMTNTPTMDTAATVAQCIRLIEAGCELVRITAQSIAEAKNLALIKQEIRKAGFDTPLIADVHFKPAVAEVAARLVEKVRINPGNYTDKRSQGKTFSVSSYYEELERIAQRLDALLRICREHGTAIRIGTNHGSLSWRIMERYGDSPLGMAESAMEFVRICNTAGFHNLVLSMKSSNVRVMVEATRLLVRKMMREKMQYPVHLGVTEAGNGLEGRMKSAAGIGTLLTDGIGDTIRVSLTEAPENEIPVAQQIVAFFPAKIKKKFQVPDNYEPGFTVDFGFERRNSQPAGSIGNGNVPVVLREDAGVQTIDEDGNIEGNHGAWAFPVEIKNEPGKIQYVRLEKAGSEELAEILVLIKQLDYAVLVFMVKNLQSLPGIRKFIREIDRHGINLPVILSFEDSEPDLSRFAVSASLHLAPLLNDGLCDGIFLQNKQLKSPAILETAFGILQATHSRITQNEYIACPGCGRTQYDLEGTLEKVKNATAHLKGLKIAVMGCIVNGPGEMADADFGYVGQGNGRVSIYKGKTLVKKNIPEGEAVRELVALMMVQGHSSQ